MRTTIKAKAEYQLSNKSKRLRAYITGALRGTDETARKEKTMTNTTKTPKTYFEIRYITIKFC